MKILAFAASLRSGSYNHKLVDVAAEIARKHGANVEIANFHEFTMPLYDGDLNDEIGLPAGAVALQRRIERADAMMIATPEYNYSISGVLKNAFDWVSRARPMPWRGKSIYLMSASPSSMGGIRGLWQTRVPFEGCGALVFPDMFALANAHKAFKAFDDRGQLIEPSAHENLERQIAGFLLMAEALVPVCGKAATGAAHKRQKEVVAALEDQSSVQPPPP
ncbi:MAG: NAD(P)H-dependent oxidoreductase [Polyangiaceae bacterium]|nr:NAD(P)H-dependent oxidoreductase [Polyangiaceae bacterium]